MEKEEAEEIIELVVTAFPTFIEKKNEQDNPKLRVKLLYQKLLERSYKPTLEKVHNYIDTSSYEPKLADLLPPKPYKPDKRWEEHTYE